MPGADDYLQLVPTARKGRNEKEREGMQCKEVNQKKKRQWKERK